MATDKQKRRELESGISDHKRQKKKLHPPLFQLMGVKKSASWINTRLPEMLWACLAITGLGRADGLDFFRHVIKYVNSDHDCLDISLSGISLLPENKRAGLIAHIFSWRKDIKLVLRPMMLFPDLPALNDWKKHLDEPIPNEDWPKVGEAVSKCFWHQSEQATDCRWVRILAYIVGGKIKFVEKMEDSVRGIFEYPNYGDQAHLRGFIRAGEIGMPIGQSETDESFKWSNSFWKFCYDKTSCVAEHSVNKEWEKRRKLLQEESERLKDQLMDQAADLRNSVIDHFFKTSVTSGIDSRHEGAFGITLYAVTLLIEIVFYRTPLSITARLGLRSLAESLITLSYLLKKETDEPKIWDGFRTYGAGQLKLIYLKTKNLKQTPSSIDLDELDYLANEDSWIEFNPINLGHWDDIDLRKMSEFVEKKDIYDRFYNYSSGFIHSSWGAIRESVLQKCINPLHRFHKLPTYDLPLMPSVTQDAISLVNSILGCLSQAYPSFDLRLKMEEQQPQSDSSNSKETKTATKEKPNT